MSVNGLQADAPDLLPVLVNQGLLDSVCLLDPESADPAGAGAEGPTAEQFKAGHFLLAVHGVVIACDGLGVSQN